jgi:UDP-3-O-acyl N-acetylglucosamine deacetylase
MPGRLGTVRVIGYRHQRTLASEVVLEGVGLVTGVRARLRLRPAGPNTGLVFRRVDRPGSPAVPALVPFVSGTERRTSIGPAASGVTLVEHLLATLAGLRIDNCLLELDGPEPPGLDGSAAGFAVAVARVGAALQPARRPIRSVTSPVVVSQGKSTITLHPACEPGLRATYVLDYGPHAPIPRQTSTTDIRPETFFRDVAPCRTFVTEAEGHDLRSRGIGRHLSGSDLLVFGPRGLIDNRLRYADEPARHKILDIIGDLALCGFDLAGHVVAYRSGHALNVELARALTTLAAAGTAVPLTRRSA